MPDISILDPAVHAAPKAYKVKGAEEIVLKAITATYDGTGAAGSFIPAVQVIDPSGFVVGTYTLGQTLAAGASADVSWFPVGGTTTSSGGGTTIAVDEAGVPIVLAANTLNFQTGATVTDAGGGIAQVDISGGGGAITDLDSPNGTVTITNGTGPTVDVELPVSEVEVLVGTSTVTAGSAVNVSYAYQSGSTFMNLGTPTTPKFSTAGVYAVNVWLSWANPNPGPITTTAYCGSATFGLNSITWQNLAYNWLPYVVGASNAGRRNVSSSGAGIFGNGHGFTTSVVNTDPSNSVDLSAIAIITYFGLSL